jgi:hypothetical protein
MGDATNPAAGFNVNKTRGYVQFRDTDPGVGTVEVPVAYATGDPLNPWIVVTEDVAGHAVRALYMARGEWSVQVYRAAARYRITEIGGAIAASNGLQAMECFAPSPSNPVGQPTRIYFPLADLGQRVNVGEIWYRDSGGLLRSLNNQNLIIDRVENLGGRDHAYAELAPLIGAGSVLDFSQGYAVRRVRGASMTIRVLHNDASFNLTPDPVENYERLGVWARTWRRHETESYVLGGSN